ncbi:MAG: twin-arginine translocase subunit TatB [Proteobacteria bacterium]|nr:twin-arginine translocase subunit TatB [Pseudomonadota bacterium]
MFDIGFTEMMLIGIVALVVIGPERLPAVARTAGKYFSKLRNFMSSVRADVESELKADELRQIFEKQQEEIQSLKEVVSDVGKDIGLSDIANSISDTNPEPEVTPKPATNSIARPKPKAKPKARARAKSKAVAKTKLSPKNKAKAEIKAKSKAKPRSKAKSKARPRAKSVVKEG